MRRAASDMRSQSPGTGESESSEDGVVRDVSVTDEWDEDRLLALDASAVGDADEPAGLEREVGGSEARQAGRATTHP